jgi:putative intracellular protease/amidase
VLDTTSAKSQTMSGYSVANRAKRQSAGFLSATSGKWGALMSNKQSLKRSIVFFLVPDFSMIAFATAIEPLRIANRMLGYESYRWRLTSLDGKPVAASNGVMVEVNSSLDEERRKLMGLDKPSMIFVCSGVNVEKYNNKSVFGFLREEYHRGVAVGGLCTGAYILANAGLLSGKRCAIHWEGKCFCRLVRDRLKPLYLRRRHGSARHDGKVDRRRS